MVSLWPWRGDDNSPASFEKTLSGLSIKVSKTSARLDLLRQRSRRYKVLWTLYMLFAYMLSTIILVIVIGWDNWGPSGYSAVAGGPVVIYLGRLLLTTYYDYRISRVQAGLDTLEKQRDATIEKLKAATKYNTTQQLLDKYGSPPSKISRSTSNAEGPRKRQGKQAAKPSSPAGGQRTGVAPPPTANIPRGQIGPSLPITPMRPLPNNKNPLQNNVSGFSPSLASGISFEQGVQPGAPEFAPNAFSTPSRDGSSVSMDGPKWYDRIMDLLLGEDETQAKNRLALICRHCKVVNGLAPPGAKRQEDVGMWKCSSCGGSNWEESEATKIVAAAEEEAKKAVVGDRASIKHEGHNQSVNEKEDESEPGSPESVSDAGASEEQQEYTDEKDDSPEKKPTRKGRSKGASKKRN